MRLLTRTNLKKGYYYFCIHYQTIVKMKLKLTTLCFTALFSALGFAQTDAQEVLFKVDTDPVYLSEFVRVYNKNLSLVQDESQKDVDEYLKLFTNYKLKLKEAEALGFQEKETYKKELDTYRKQLAKNYLTDHKVTDALINEAYENISNDVKANHILVRVAEGASAKDTLAAYNKIEAIRARAQKEGFEAVRKELHNGKTVFGEELGWFTGFRMVYKFEKVAFTTPLDSISKPFKTRFGYHILKVLGKRKARGSRTVKHIMIGKKNDTANTAQGRINDIYQKIQQGEEFETLAKQFSDDKSSAPAGGLIKAFSSGDLSVPEFEDAAFALENKGDMSQPVETDFGWHIIKLEKKTPVKTFKELKPELEQQVKQSDRSQLIEESFIERLMQKYKVNENKPDLSYFVSILNEDYDINAWKLPADFKEDTPFIKIRDKQYLYKDFGTYLEKSQRMKREGADNEGVINDAYDRFIKARVRIAERDNLEKDNPEFAAILKEYREGLLLFDLMDSTIWQSAKTDSVEVQAFYNANKDNYFWPKRALVEVASSSNKKTAKKVAKLIENDSTAQAIKALINLDGKVNVIFTKDTMSAGHQALPKDFTLEKGISKIHKHDKSYIVAKVFEVYPKKNKPFEAVKGIVMSDYQNDKEKVWLEELRNKYKVVVNQDVLKKAKAKIKNQ